MKELIGSKVSLNKLEESEEKLQALIDRVLNSINKRFMDKSEVNKSLNDFKT